MTLTVFVLCFLFGFDYAQSASLTCTSQYFWCYTGSCSGKCLSSRTCDDTTGNFKSSSGTSGIYSNNCPSDGGSSCGSCNNFVNCAWCPSTGSCIDSTCAASSCSSGSTKSCPSRTSTSSPTPSTTRTAMVFSNASRVCNIASTISMSLPAPAPSPISCYTIGNSNYRFTVTRSASINDYCVVKYAPCTVSYQTMVGNGDILLSTFYYTQISSSYGFGCGDESMGASVGTTRESSALCAMRTQ